jgi:voltage-gated potassium channel
MGNAQQFTMKRMERAFETGRILPYLMLSVAAFVVGFAALIRLVDPHDFPSLGLALWWAVSTVTTVGYGDVVPTSPWGRAVASVLMVIGYASLSLLTGIVASLLVYRRTAQAETGLDRIERRLDEVERLIRGKAG